MFAITVTIAAMSVVLRPISSSAAEALRGRVLEKAGFTLIGETEDEHEGTTLRVHRWELTL